MTLSKIKRSIASSLVFGSLALATLGSSFAAAESGSSAVGGGQWSWSSIPGVYCSSSYYHGSVIHSASAQVGTGSVKVDVKNPGHTAQASASGVGTTRVWWNTY